MRVRCMLLPPTLPLLYIELHIIDGFKKKINLWCMLRAQPHHF